MLNDVIAQLMTQRNISQNELNLDQSRPNDGIQWRKDFAIEMF